MHRALRTYEPSVQETLKRLRCAAAQAEVRNMAGDKDEQTAVMHALMQRIEHAVEAFDKASIAELIRMYDQPGRMLSLSLLSGVARGFGIAIGFSVIGALFAALLVRLAALNLPVIGEFIASVAQLVQYEMQVP